MQHQFFGLIVLALAVSAMVFLASNGDSLLQLKLPVLGAVHSISLSASDFINGVNTDPNRFPEIAYEPVPVTEEPEASAAEMKIAPVKESVRIRDIWWPTSSRPLEVILEANLNRDEIVDVTGWTIKGNYGFFIIPQAQRVYSFGGSQGDIVLGYRDSVHLYSGQGPKGNLRLNKCLGYFEETSPFTPSIPKKCPEPTRSEIESCSGYCEDYLLSLEPCERPSANPPVPYDDAVCRDLLKTLNYSGCVEKYKNDEDFLLDEWWVWLDDKINIFDRIHDRVQLIDGKGNVISEYKY